MRWMLVCLLMAGPLWAAQLTDPMSLTPTDDTYLRPSHTGKPGGIGTRDEFQVYGAKENKKQLRTLLKFNLDEIPRPPTQAILRVYAWNIGTPKKTEVIRCHPVLRRWDEHNASWDMAQDGDPWANLGGDFDPRAISGVNITTAHGGQDGWWLDFDITPLVQQWIAKRQPNYGVILLFEDGCSAQVRLRSKDFKDADKQPKLELGWGAKLSRGPGMVMGSKLPPYGDPVKMEPQFATQTLNAARMGEGFTQEIKVRGGAKPYKWSATGLPEGVALNAENGNLSGKIDKAGRYAINVTVTGADNKRSTQRFELVVQDPKEPIADAGKKPDPLDAGQKPPEEKKPDKPILVDE